MPESTPDSNLEITSEPEGSGSPGGNRNNTDPERAQDLLYLQASVFAGPLPPPEKLQQYEDVSPGIAARIVGMAEKEQADRFERGQRKDKHISFVLKAK